MGAAIYGANGNAGQAVGAEPLEEFFAHTPRFAVAFSGGCDSAYLLAAAVAAGCQVKAYMVNTAFQAAFEHVDALRVADALRAAMGGQSRIRGSFELEVVEADVLSQQAVCDNPPDRCYVCKRFIFGTIFERMRADGCEVLADGTNATDDPARRPGFRALAELGVVSPLRRAGMTKDQVRAASAWLERALNTPEGAFMSAKPSFSCLATRVPAGERLTAESLMRAAQEAPAR